MGRANTKYRTEKRKANVGERILITNAGTTFGEYDNGDIFTVDNYFYGLSSEGVHVRELPKDCEGHSLQIYDREYEVIIEESALSTHCGLTRLAEAEAKIAALEEEVKALRGAFKIGAGKTKLTENQRRVNVIARAKEYVKKYDSFGTTTGRGGFRVEGIICDAEFIVNPEKRTVVCLLKGQIRRGLISKGIAKCMDEDVFNADIGKAIALAKARGRVPDRAFRYAPQPTEVVVGMRVDSKYSNWDAFKVAKILTSGTELYDYDGTWASPENAIIIDDSEAVYE